MAFGVARKKEKQVQIFYARPTLVKAHQPLQSVTMTSYTWSPGSMSFPADRIAQSYYPFHPKYGGSKPVRTGCAGGINTAYPVYLNNCQSCGGQAPSACSGKYPSGFGGRDYYNPSGTPYDALEYGARNGTCDAKRGCLDPRAANYDKMALTHCQSLCEYPQPQVCIAQRPDVVESEQCECQLDEFGLTPEQAIYSKQRRNTRAHQVAKHVKYHQMLNNPCW